MSDAPGPLQQKAIAFFRWLGLPGIALLGAALCDLLIIVPAALDDAGPRGDDLVVLPGVVGMVACALWAKRRPAVAAVVGAAVLVFSSALIRLSPYLPYSTLLRNVTLSETVAGFELVMLAVRRLRPGVAFATTSTLVIGCLIAVIGRRPTSLTASAISTSLVAGLAVLVVAIAVGLQTREGKHAPAKAGLTRELLREHWPIAGALSLVGFLDVSWTMTSGNERAVPLLLFSLAAAAMAIYSHRQPVRAGIGLAAVLLMSAIAAPLLGVKGPLVIGGGMPVTQVFAGLILVVNLIRFEPRRSAWTLIGVLSVVVALAAGINGSVSGRTGARHMFDLSTMRTLFVIALLLLGIAVALGLYLRSRDSERKQVVKAAVTDAQTSERMALARELHDVVAHHVTGIVVQAQAAKMMGEKDPQVAVEAMDRIEHAGTEALVAMRRLVRSMRGDAATGSGTSEVTEQATTDLAADLRKLVGEANHGVPTELDLDLPGTVPQEVARSALRLVQESLTNIGKHAADATEAVVLAHVSGGELHLWIRDDGRARTPGEDRRPAGGSGGYGLIGMRERVELLHGRLDAGPAPNGGWRVEAWLPLEGDE
ncbi:sensor histidine kinase [Amycolatopsis sp. CA-230715]|uniref:sensor histidine kinase n=1 Tax=Amycolatopsis sp. CA-230715 TaxID=2745196 RepID=UPI0020B3A98F|nr:histidine kinase [Amycolatopsis sp. CA-230715]